MTEELNLILPPEVAFDEAALRDFLSRRIKSENFSYRIVKRSVDARKPVIKVNVTLQILSEGEAAAKIDPFRIKDVSSCREIIVAGLGPAGLFSALSLIEAGFKPIIIERGNEVPERKRDVAAISTRHIVNPDSNYCFGEGGAGTFSDGKLYTRSKKRGDNHRVLELLVLHGADPAILYEAHPHLGTDRLPRIISSIRETILKCGGIIMFKSRITDIIIENSCFRGVEINKDRVINADDIVLATGHSARDIYQLLLSHNVKLVYKPFAIGVRVEHPQEMIDRIQYHGKPRGKYLPAAAYTLVTQADGRGVYSFCMCPGGFIVPSATAPEEVVVNGMSPSGRNSLFANSGVVVELREEDIPEEFGEGPLAGMYFQQSLEKLAWEQGGRSQCAPAQRLADFVTGRKSLSLPKISYFPGATPSALHEWLPGFISSRLQRGFSAFGKSLKGYITNDAVVVAVESRTSSPVRIVRDRETMTAEGITGLYPAGEGAGYAGGIVSSAVDGTLVAKKIAEKYH
jgi:uncharacterized protein